MEGTTPPPQGHASSGGSAGGVAPGGSAGAAGVAAHDGGATPAGSGGSGGAATRDGGATPDGTLAVDAGGSSPDSTLLPTTTGTLVPLYTYPTDPSWLAVINAKLAHPSVPVIAVINPEDGPGASLNADYVKGIAALLKAGVSVLGYVSTAYTVRSETAVNADIDSYRRWYPQMTGIFFDEQTNTPGGEDYYRRVVAYARSNAFTFTVGNPGTDTAPTYVGTVDMILVYESAGLPSARTMAGWHTGYDRHNFGIIPYGVSALDPAFLIQAKANVGYIYVTGDTLPNPWDSVPSYFDALVAQLATL